jgi:hypothetical protein
LDAGGCVTVIEGSASGDWFVVYEEDDLWAAVQAVKLGTTMSSIGFSWKVASDCSRPRLRGGGCGNCFRTRAIFPMRGR